MPLEKFDIQLDNVNKSYFAGQVVSGQVLVVLTEKSKLIHGVKLKLVGRAKTHWKETAGRSTTHFSEEETYIDRKLYLLGYETESSELTLEEGEYKYPFSFPLPATLPSSFCHKYGQVKYHLQATITRNRKSNYTSKLAFTINGLLDLNQESVANAEGQMSNEKTVCCFCCASGPVGFDFKVGKQGFVPGEQLSFQVHMYNHSNRGINFTAVQLIQELTFIARMEHTKTRTVQICQLEGPKVPCGEETDWIAMPSALRIPPVPPSRLDGCKIIDISYHLKFKMEANNAATLKDSLQIVIGTIPLRDNFSQISATDSSLICQQLENTFDSYPDLPPPSYEDAMNGTKAEDAGSTTSDPPDYGSIDWKSFIPKYALYKFNNN